MKTISLLLVFCVVALNLNAQSDENPKTIFGNGTPDMGYFIRPTCSFGKIAGTTAVLPGVGMGIILNNKLSLSLNYKLIVTENTPVGEADTRLYLDQQYFGLKCEYSIFPISPVHANFYLDSGVGHTELDLKDAFEFDYYDQTDASFGYLEPGAAIELNIWKYIRMDFGAGYRFASKVTYRSLTEKNLVGVNYFVGLKIGIF
jgi:hypothetical protein